MNRLLLNKNSIPCKNLSFRGSRSFVTKKNLRTHPLGAIFNPSSVAVIGATNRPKAVGRNIVWNLLNNPFGGAIYPVSLSNNNVLGVRAYKSIKDVPDKVDLAIIATPRDTVKSVVQECVDAKVQGAIIVTHGFGESNAEGVKLQSEIREIAANRLRIVGPNSLGIMNPIAGLNATIVQKFAIPGSVGFLSESGAFCEAVLDWSLSQNVGFSSFVSVGGMTNVDWGDLIHYLGNDPHTKSILLYMESIGNAKSFVSAAREVALTKPIIAIKGGRTPGGNTAARIHVGSDAGDDEVVDAVFRRCGVMRVNRIEELFSLSDVLCKQPRPKGKKLLIMTNAGGPGVLATDGLIIHDGEMAPLAPSTKKALDAILPQHWSHGNPVDILGDASPELYAKSFRVVAENPESDGTLVILTPQAMTDPTRTATEIVKIYEEVAPKMNGPVLTSWMGGESVQMGAKILNEAGIPSFHYPDLATQIFDYMWKYSSNLESIYETPKALLYTPSQIQGQQQTSNLLAEIRREGRTNLSEYESKLVLQSYGISTIECHLAKTADEAVEVARKIGFPVTLKLHSTSTYKTEFGEKTNLISDNEVTEAFKFIKSNTPAPFEAVSVQKVPSTSSSYELIISSRADPQFGPVITFSAGGPLAEIYKDSSLGLPPLNMTLARRMIERTQIYHALKGYRGSKAINLDNLCEMVVHCSRLLVNQPLIKSLLINPLLATPTGIFAVDARITIHPTGVPESKLSHPIIRPYPAQYSHDFTLPDGNPATVRPIMPSDEPLMAEFNKNLTDKAVYLRYFQHVARENLISHEELVRMCVIDYSREIGMVVVTKEDGKDKIIGLAQLVKSIEIENEGQFMILISENYQKMGLGSLLLKDLIEIAKAEKLGCLTGEIPKTSTAKHFASECGFTLTEREDVIHILKKL